MEKYIPYEKLSKKKKRELDAAKRNTWGSLNPTTRKPQSSKAYNRRKAQDWKREKPEPVPFYLILPTASAPMVCEYLPAAVSPFRIGF